MSKVEIKNRILKNILEDGEIERDEAEDIQRDVDQSERERKKRIKRKRNY